MKLKNNLVKFLSLDQIIELKTTSKSITKKDYILDGEYDVITSSIKPSGKYNQYNQDENQITITKDGTCGFVTWQYKKFWLAAGSFVVKPREDFKINMKYLFYYLKNSQNEIENMKVGSPIAHLYKKHLYQLKIPIPPLDKQNQIVKILDTFSTLINDLEQGIPAEIKLRQQQYEYYRNLLLTFKEDENDKRT